MFTVMKEMLRIYLLIGHLSLNGYLQNMFLTMLTFCCATQRKYCKFLFDVKGVSLVPTSNRNNVIKALTVLSKFTGQHEQFKSSLKNFGIKLHKQNGIESFLRMLKANESDILDWYVKAYDAVRDNERLYLSFCKVSGIRKEEAINSFNLIIELAKQSRLSEYYDSELNCLMHFKYPQMFLRNTKNVYISFVPERLINQIINSQPITYPQIRKRMNRYKLKVRISELRDYFGTSLLQHGILEQDVNLLQGRIPVSVFIRHYWSPRLKELGNRVFKALETLDMK
jgi:intergrase/recombinase